MCLPNFMIFHHCLFKILKNQNFADRRTNRQHVNSIPPQIQFAGGKIKKIVEANAVINRPTLKHANFRTVTISVSVIKTTDRQTADAWLYYKFTHEPRAQVS